MAEVYRGLTIEIGADTSKLDTSLKNINAALRDTQKTLSGVDKALKLNPQSTNLLAQRVNLLGERLGELGAKMASVRTEYAKLDASTESYRDAVGNATMSAKIASDEYGKVCAKLAKQNDEMREAVQIAKEFSERFSGSDMSGVRESIDGVIAKFKQLGMLEKDFQFDAATDDVNVLIEKMRLLAEVEDRLMDASPKGMTKAVQAMEQLGFVSNDTRVELSKLYKQYHAVSEQMHKMKDVVAYIDKGAEVARLEEEMRQTAAAIVEADMKAKLFRADTEAIDMAVRQLGNEFRVAEEAAKMRGVDFEPVVRAVKTSDAVVTSLEHKLGSLKESLRGIFDGTTDKRYLSMSVEELSDSIVRLRGKTEKASFALAEMQNRLTSDIAELRKLDEGTEAFEVMKLMVESSEDHVHRLTNAYKTLSTAYADAMNAQEARKLIVQMQEVENSIKDVKRRMDELKNSWASIMQSVRAAGYGLYSTITPAIMLMGSRVIDVTREIDSAYRDLRKTVEATEETYEDMFDAALKYSTTHVTSAAEMLEIEALLAQVGVAQEAISKVSEVVANLSVATSLTSEELSTQLGQLMSTMGLSADEATNFGDALVRLGNNMATTETQIMEVISYMGAAATQYGFTADQALGWAAAMASSGQGAEAAGSAFTRVMADIESAVAKGGEGLTNFANVAGVSAKQFADTWSSDPSKAMEMFIDGLARVQKSGGSVEMALQNLGFANVRDKQLLRALAQEVMNTDGSFNTLSKSLVMSRDAWNQIDDQFGSAGDAANEAEKKAEGFSGTVQQLSNNFEVLCYELGDAFVPILNTALGFVQSFTSAVKETPRALVTAAETFTLFTAALGPAAVGISSIYQGWKGMNEAFGSLGKSLSAYSVMAAESTSKLAQSAGKLSGVLGQLMLSFESLSFLGKLGVTALFASVAVAALNVANAIGEANRKAKELDKATTGMTNALKGVSDSSGKAADGLGNIADKAKSISKAVDKTVSELSKLTDSFTETMDGVEATSMVIDGFEESISKVVGKKKMEVDSSDYAAAQLAIDSLNSTIGENITLTVSNTGELKLYKDGVETTIEAVNELGDAYVNAARQQARASVYAGIAERQAEAELEAARAKSALQELGYSEAGMERLMQNSDRYMPGVNENTRILAGSLKAANEVIESCNEDLALLNEQYGITEQKTSLATAGFFGMNKALEETADDAEEMEKSISAASDKLYSMSRKNKGLYDYIGSLGLTFEGFAAAVQSTGTASIDEFASHYEQTLSRLVDGTNTIKSALEENEISVWDYIGNIEANNEVQQRYNTVVAGLQEAASQSWNKVDKDFVTYLSGLGAEYTDAIEQAASDSSVYESWRNAWYEATKLAGGDSVNYLQSLTDDLKLPIGIDVEKLGEELAAIPEKYTPVMTESGVQLGTGLSQGIDSSVATSVTPAVTNMVSALLATFDSAMEINSPSRVMAEKGKYIDEGLAEGISNNTEGISTAIDSIRSLISQAFETIRADGVSYGINFARGLALGISSGGSSAIAAATSVAAQSLAAARSTLDINSPSKETAKLGDYFAQGFAVGIARSTYEPVESAANMAMSAFRAADVKQAYAAAPRVSKADIFDAVSEAFTASGASNTTTAAVYIDGRRLANATARHNDAALGNLSVRKGR